MDRVFHHDDTMYEAATKVYVSPTSSDIYAYADSACTVKLTAEVLEELFVRGMVIVDGGGLYAPVSCITASKVATVTYVKADKSTATTAVLSTIKSA